MYAFNLCVDFSEMCYNNFCCLSNLYFFHCFFLLSLLSSHFPSSSRLPSPLSSPPPFPPPSPSPLPSLSRVIYSLPWSISTEVTSCFTFKCLTSSNCLVPNSTLPKSPAPYNISIETASYTGE